MVHVQRAVPPVTVGQAAPPDHVVPAREERGAQDAAPRPPRPPGVAQRRVRTQRTAHHDHEVGQCEQREGGDGGAGRGAEVAVDEGEHGRGDQQIPDDERQFAGGQRGDGGERAEPAPPDQRTRDAQGIGCDRPLVPDWHQELPAMRRHTNAGCWSSVIGSASSARTRPVFLANPAGREPRARRDRTGAASARHIRPIDTASCALDLLVGAGQRRPGLAQACRLTIPPAQTQDHASN